MFAALTAEQHTENSQKNLAKTFGALGVAFPCILKFCSLNVSLLFRQPLLRVVIILKTGKLAQNQFCETSPLTKPTRTASRDMGQHSDSIAMSRLLCLDFPSTKTGKKKLQQDPANIGEVQTCAALRSTICVTFAPLKQWIHIRNPAEIVGLPTERGVFRSRKRANSPWVKGGRKRRKKFQVVADVW